MRQEIVDLALANQFGNIYLRDLGCAKGERPKRLLEKDRIEDAVVDEGAIAQDYSIIRIERPAASRCAPNYG